MSSILFGGTSFQTRGDSLIAPRVCRLACARRLYPGLCAEWPPFQGSGKEPSGAVRAFSAQAVGCSAKRGRNPRRPPVRSLTQAALDVIGPLRRHVLSGLVAILSSHPGFVVSLALDACTLGCARSGRPFRARGRSRPGRRVTFSAKAVGCSAKRGRNPRRTVSLHFDSPEP